MLVPAVLHEKVTRGQFSLCLFTWESPFGGLYTMQYDTHGLYFMKRNIAKDRLFLLW